VRSRPGAAQHATTPGTAPTGESRRAAEPERGSADGRTSQREPDRSERIDRDAAERVIRRAVSLSESASDDDDGLSVAALLAAADDLGMDRAEVERALAEERVGLLADGPRVGDRWLGPDRVVVARVVEGSPDEALERLDAWMRLGRVLRRVRRESDRAVYARRSDPAAIAQRTVRAARGGERLARVRRLVASVVAVGDGRCLVVLSVNTSASRLTATAGATTVAATGVVTAGVAAVDWVPWAWVGVPVALAGGAGVVAARRAYLADVDEDLEAVLDDLSAGRRPVTLVDSVTARFVGATDRGVAAFRSRRPGPRRPGPGSPPGGTPA
jgi:hypothetical protein